MITALDHVNIRTNQVDKMTTWYETYIGLKSGPRPDFPFGGAWLYAGEHPIVHLVDAEERLAPKVETLQIEHAAFRATDFQNFVETLAADDVPYHLAKVPGLPIVQVNVFDPDGNHLHIDFHADEVPGADDL